MVPRLPPGFSHPLCVGKGAFASVYRARQTGLDRSVAVKIIVEKDRKKREEYLREARVQAQISLDGIPNVFDAFEWGQRVCIIMEWIKGVSLAALLETPLLASERLYLARMFLEVLAGLHALGFAHRDLKPSNILVSADDNVFLVDFGFTKNTADGHQSFAFVAKGTPAYMAPEVWEHGSDIDLKRADLFSAGKILRQILADTPQAALADKLVAPRPEERPASGREALALWEDIPGTETAHETRPRTAASLSSNALADLLVQSAKQLLYDNRTDEAYWLLVEALQENGDHVEGIRLISDIGAFRINRRVTSIAKVAALGVVACGIVLFAFFAGRHSSNRLALDLRYTDHSKAGAGIIKNPKSQPDLPEAAALFSKEDTTHNDRLAGRLIVKFPHGAGTIFIDGKETSPDSLSTVGRKLSYGSHSMYLCDTTGAVRWKEQVTLLPFQAKTIPVVLSSTMEQKR